MSLREERKRYAQLAERWPQLFKNLPDAPYEILFDAAQVDAAESEECRRLLSRGQPASWSQTGVAYEDPYLIVLRDAVRRPNGTLGTYVRTTPASGAAGAAVLPLLAGKIVLLRHFRHATRRWHLEIPRGFAEVGVTAADQARKELREEIQAHAHNLVHLGAFHSNTGAATDQAELFLAEIHAFGSPQTSEGIESIQVRTPYEVAQFIAGDTGSDPAEMITDSFTIGAFTRASLRGFLPGLQPLRSIHSR